MRSVSGEALSGGIFNFPASKFLSSVYARKTLPFLYYSLTVQHLLAERHDVYLPGQVKQYRSHILVSFEAFTAVIIGTAFLVCDIARSCMQTPTFVRNMLPPSSGLKSPYNHEGVGSMFIRNAGIHLQGYAVS